MRGFTQLLLVATGLYLKGLSSIQYSSGEVETSQSTDHFTDHLGYIQLSFVDAIQ